MADMSDLKNSYREEKKKWMELAEIVKAAGNQRDWKELRGAYQRWKVTAKRNLASHRRTRSATGGGPSISSSSDQNFQFKPLSLTNFEMDDNPLDSDDMQQSGTNTSVTDEEKPEVLYALDPATGDLIPSGGTIDEPTPSTSNAADLDLPDQSKEMIAFEEGHWELQKKMVQNQIRYQAEKHEAEMYLLRLKSDAAKAQTTFWRRKLRAIAGWHHCCCKNRSFFY